MAEPAAWIKITPEHLLSAVKHIRVSFKTCQSEFSEITTKLGYAALHPQVTDVAALVDYQAAFEVYRQMIGRTAEAEFNNLSKTGTPAAVFRAYFDAYYEGLKVNVRDQFNEMLKVGLANSGALNRQPVEWAHSQLRFLVEGHHHSTERWIKEVCDTQDVPAPELIAKEFEEVVFWKKWRAPKLIHMQPAGNTRYDPATAWTREDETMTGKLLEARCKRFIQFLDIVLDKIARDAHVHVAQSKEYAPALQNPVTVGSASDNESSANAQRRQIIEKREGLRYGAPMSVYRSEVKRGIVVQLTRKPYATDLEICRGLDADGAVELPSGWQIRPGDRLFVGAYSNAKTRRKVEIAISKVRTDLRKKGLLDRR